MFLGYQNGKIKFYTDNELDKELYSLDKVEETQEEYIIYNNEYVLKSLVIDSLLQEAKDKKRKEASDMAKYAIENGYIEYKNAKIETNTQTVSDLNSLRQLCILLGKTSYNWLSKDDIPLTLNIDVLNTAENDDFAKIGILISEYKNNIWTEKYVDYLNRINSSQTLEELDDIVIAY